MKRELYNRIVHNRKVGKKMLAVLIDPDKANESHLEKVLSSENQPFIDFLFIGGSLLTSGNMRTTLTAIRKISNLPLVIFPGDGDQVDDQADAILLLSLISGRNAELLIGKHVASAIRLKRSGLEIISTGYMLVDGGVETTASYITGTQPLPSNKPGIAAMTALAGQQLGNQVIYLDAGSGAARSVPAEIMKGVRNQVDIPIIVGGGIKSRSSIQNAWDAGADVVVIGNALEEDPQLLPSLFSEAIKPQ